MIKPDYSDFGLSYPMKETLRKEVERQLSEDSRHYGIDNEILKYDWSESVIEGKCSTVLLSHVDNFSGIKVFDSKDEFIAEGWMDFIHEEQHNLLLFTGTNLTLIRMEKISR